MPGKIKVKVLAGRNLPVMDRASDTTDAFVEIKFGGVTHKTDVCRKSLNPHWNNTEWYRFEVDESELQDEPLQLRLMDHDTYSANDAIGKVVISLAPLLAREANNVKGTAGPPGGAVMSGWIPVFDTMHGIRGELNVIVKVELFSDFNKYKTSSCGVQFFHCPSIPPGYRATSVHGFVEELVVNDDPEYQWIDKIRTPRASNEARQVAFIKLSNQVQRLVGLKAAELGANAVVGYQQEFDLEGEAGVVARAIGTAVSITPLPTPSQPMNIPPCTQQQLKKCLDILATDDDSVTDLSQYYQTHQEELQKMISILNPKDPSMLDEAEAADDDDDKVEQSGRLSIHSFTGSMSLFHDDQIHHRSLRHLSDDQTDLNKLLNRKDDDEDSDSSGPIQKIKKLKTNFFTKRFSKRKHDKKEKQDDQISIKSNSSDTSRISLVEIKNELKKRFKKPKIRKTFTNPDDEGVGMASILARSVIHAHTSLACIAETQDSEHSTQETMRRTSESEPNINPSDDDKPRKISIEKVAEFKNEMEGITVPDIHFSSLKNMSSEDAPPERVRKISESCPSSPMVGRSENLLKLPGDKGYFGSVSSALSGESSEEYSSSDEEDDESSDIKTDSEESLETTASVVNSVLKHEANPVFVAQMERKLTNLESVHPLVSEIIRADTPPQEEEKATKCLEEQTKQENNNTENFEKEKNTEENIDPQEKNEVNEPSTSTQDSDKCVQKSNMHHIKIHNFSHNKPSKSFSAPSSPVSKSGFLYRSSKRIKHQLAKLSKSSMIKSISHCSLLTKKKNETKTLSQPGSSSNVTSRAPSDTVLGSLFLSYSDLLSLDKEGLQASQGMCKSDEFDRMKVSMYIGSEPVSRTSLSGSLFPSHYREKEKAPLKPVGLIHTAMETILIDKVDTLLLPTSPDPISKNDKQFFDDVSEKLEEHKNRGSSSLGLMNMGQVQSSTGSTTPRVVAMTPKRLSDDLTSHSFKFQDTRNSISESKGLVHTAMETILLDKANAVLPETPESIHQMKGSSQDVHEKSKHKDHNFLSTIKTSLKEHHVNLDSVFGKHHAKKENSPDVKSGGLVHAAMQTMLMDRAQSMIPDTPEPIPIRTEPIFDRASRSRKESENQDSVGLIHSAMQTILMDKVQAVLPNSSEPVPIHLDNTDTKPVKGSPHTEETSSGLVHSAMQTILMDKVQAVLPDTSEPIPVHLDNIDTKSKSSKGSPHSEESSGLIHSAMQTILIDKVQAVLPDTSYQIPVHLDDTNTKPVKERLHVEQESKGLVHSAMQTILMDKVQAVLPETKDPTPVHLDKIGTKSIKESLHTEPESSGLIHSAMQTILMDKVQVILPETNDPIPVHLDNTGTKPITESPHIEPESSGLIHSAMQTILMDKVQTVLPDKSVTIPIHLDDRTTLFKCKESEKIKPDTLSDSSTKTLQTDNVEKKDDSKKSVYTAVETLLIDRVQTTYPNSTDPDLISDLPVEEFKEKYFENKPIGKPDEESGLIKTAVQTILLDKVQSLVGAPTNRAVELKSIPTEDLKSPSLVGTAMQTILMDKLQSAISSTSTENVSNPTAETVEVSKDRKPKDSPQHSEDIKSKEEVLKPKRLIRQDSVDSISDAKDSHNMSNEDLSNMSPSKVTRTPVLQHFHPMISGLETIPSMSESSFERSLDGESAFETNSASVCDNSHAACDFDRSERDRDRSERDRGSPRHARHESYGGRDPLGSAQAQASLNSTSTPMGIHRRSSDSDLSVTPKGGSLNTSAGNVGSGGGAILRPSMNTDNLDMLEYPFLTMTEYPPGFIVHIGGTVCARSVKLVDGGGESAARAAWWAELRTELRAHARALRCNAVIAYRDTCSICEDVCVLSASGTAAVINLDCDYNVDIDAPITVSNGNKSPEEEVEACSMAHVPYSPGSGPYRAELSACGGCRRARVPTVLLATCAKPNKLMAYTKAVTLTAVAARVRRAAPSAEPGARDISDQLPFLEYELHKLLLAKLRMQGANALFSLQTQIAIGERCVMALASGTAVKLHALPPPTPPRIKATENDKDALEIQRKLWDSFTANKAANGYDVAGVEHATNGALVEMDREEPPVLDLCADKDACVLELDEAEDVETARSLCVRRSHVAAYTSALHAAPTAPPHAFAQVSRARLSLSGAGGACAGAERHVSRALDCVTYKLRRLQPAALSAHYQLELPDDEIQLVVSGTAIPLVDPKLEANGVTDNGNSTSQANHNGTGDADDDIFTLDEEQLARSHPPELVEDKNTFTGQVPTAVSLTTLSQVSGVRASRRLCALRLLFVRETTAVRELGGLSGFLHTFTCEVQAIARAYTAALGGNALTSFYIRQLMLQDNAHKNQGQCLMSVGGDIVHITY